MSETTISVNERTMDRLTWLSELTGKTIQQTVESAVEEYANKHLIIETKHLEALNKPKARSETFADFDLSVRSYNALTRSFASVEDALAFPEDPAGPRGVRNLGRTMAREIAGAFYRAGYTVKGTVWEPYLW